MKDSLYTAFMLVWVGLVLGAIGTSIYVLAHFVIKYW